MKKFTLDDYIKNPTGDTARVIPFRQQIIHNYEVEYQKLLVRENGNMQYFIFRNNKNSEYTLYAKMPSSKQGIYYDVLIQFYPMNDAQKHLPSIEKYGVKFFSNDPAFVFTYAHVFYKEGILIQDLTNKLPDKVFTQAPKHTNPHKDVGYSKMFVWMYFLIKSRGLYNKNVLNTYAKTYSSTFIRKYVMHFDVIMQNRASASEDAEKHISGAVDRLSNAVNNVGTRTSMAVNNIGNEIKGAVDNVKQSMRTMFTKKTKIASTVSRANKSKVAKYLRGRR